MSTDHAAWISAAVKAACQSGAPRRTVAAVAAAVTTAILQQTAKATPTRIVEEHTGTAVAGLPGDCEALAEQLREARAKKRRDKRQRRAQAAAGPVRPPDGGDGGSNVAVEGAAMEELPNTAEDPHPKPRRFLPPTCRLVMCRALLRPSKPKACTSCRRRELYPNDVLHWHLLHHRTMWSRTSAGKSLTPKGAAVQPQPQGWAGPLSLSQGVWDCPSHALVTSGCCLREPQPREFSWFCW